jgi:HrpA-like RNA helicase
MAQTNKKNNLPPIPLSFDARKSAKEARLAKKDHPRVPMDDYEKQIIEYIKDNESSIIIGETGSGKTTRIPVFLMHAFPETKIAITQPRRVAARSVAKFVAERVGCEIGDEVGYKVRFENEVSEGTRANFMTDGMLLRKLEFDPLLEEYDIIMVDEAHERNLNIDFTLGMLKKVQALRKEQGRQELKIIVTSATMEKEKFSKYLNQPNLVEVPGRMFPVEVKYLNSPESDFTKAAANTVESICAGHEAGDILIFMPGEQEIFKTISEIEKLNIPGIEIMPLYGRLESEAQDKIFSPSPRRKVIVSTNIAETSVTIDGVKFVIDSGVIKQKQFNPKTGIESLDVVPHAQSGCEQRKGRAGRTAPGICYRLYTEDDYLSLDKFQTPEIARSNLDHVVLAMKNLGIEDVRNFDFIDPPEREAIEQAIKVLQILGALDEQEKLTALGKEMADLPLTPELARMVLEAKEFGCVKSVCTIAALLSVKSVFVRPKNKEADADLEHEKFKNPGSDFLTMLKVWEKWVDVGFNVGWARENFLNFRGLQEAKEVRAQLMEIIGQRDIASVNGNDRNEEQISKSISAGLIHKIAKHVDRRSGYEPLVALARSSENFHIHPSSAVFETEPEYVIGSDIVSTKKTYARSCQTLRLEWLPEIAPQILNKISDSLIYNPTKDQIENKSNYRIKNTSIDFEAVRPCSDWAKASAAFAEALAKGQVDLACHNQNLQTQSQLIGLRNRSGGLVKEIDLVQWYKENLRGVSSRKYAVLFEDKLVLNKSDYCPEKLETEINAACPIEIMIGNIPIEVSYAYEPEVKNGYRDRAELYRAVVSIPEELILGLKETDFPKISKDGRPEIVYQIKRYSSKMPSASLEELKVKYDQERIDNVWRNFSQPAQKEILPGGAVEIILAEGEDLPSMANLAIKPLEYAKDYKGESCLAYPGILTQSVYNGATGFNRLSYTVRFFASAVEADQASSESRKKRLAEMEKDKEDGEKVILRKKYTQVFDRVSPIMDLMRADYGNYGLTWREYQDLEGQLSSSRRMVSGTLADNQKALDMIQDIEKIILSAEEYQKNFFDKIDILQERYLALRPYISQIADWGWGVLSSDTFARNSFYSKWYNVETFFKNFSKNGSTSGFNIQACSELFDKLEGIIPKNNEYFTKEQIILNQLFSDENSGFARILKVEDGKIREAIHAKDDKNSEILPKRLLLSPGESPMKIKGNQVVGGMTSDSRLIYNFFDGYFLLSASKNEAVQIIPEEKAPNGWRAIGLIEPRIEYVASYGYDGSVFSSDAGNTEPSILAEKLAEKLAGSKERPPEKSEKTQAGESEFSDRRESLARPSSPGIEFMTDNLREAFFHTIEDAKFLLDWSTKNLPDKKKNPKEYEKFSSLVNRFKGLKELYNNLSDEIASAADATSIRGKVNDLKKRSETLARDVAKKKGLRSDWVELYDELLDLALVKAAELEIALDDTFLNRVKIQLTDLAQTLGARNDLSEKIEEILINSV